MHVDAAFTADERTAMKFRQVARAIVLDAVKPAWYPLCLANVRACFSEQYPSSGYMQDGHSQ